MGIRKSDGAQVAVKAIDLRQNYKAMMKELRVHLIVHDNITKSCYRAIHKVDISEDVIHVLDF